MQNIYAPFNCDFKVYMKDKTGNYGLLFRVLADAQYRYISRIMPYVLPFPSIILKKREVHEVVMEIAKDVLKTGRNIAEERLYSAIDTMEDLYQNETAYVRTIMSNRKGFPVAWKTARE